jgi:hypothetical protein
LVLELPWGLTNKLPSPDGSYVLYGVPHERGINNGPELWLEDIRRGNRKMLHSIGGTLRAAWSPDSTAFYVDDHLASDSTRSYIYEFPGPRRLDIADQIIKADIEANRIAKGHVYFEIEAWDANEAVRVYLHGHTDEPPIGCFDFRYVVSRLGDVKKLSQHVAPATSRGCED